MQNYLYSDCHRLIDYPYHPLQYTDLSVKRKETSIHNLSNRTKAIHFKSHMWKLRRAITVNSTT